MSGRVRVGIAVGAESVTAVTLSRSWRGPQPARVWSWVLPPMADESRPAAIVAALEELRDAIGAAEVSASFALLRPLAQAKVIATPPVGRQALEQLVQRNAQRYFISRPEAALVTAAPAGSPLARTSSRAVAVHAAEQTVAALTDAAAAADVVVERITAAPVALHQAIRALVPGVRRGRVLAIVAGPGGAEALLLEDDALRLALPLPTAACADAEAMAHTISRLIAEGDRCACRPASTIVLSGDAVRDAAAQRIVAEMEAGVTPVLVPAALEELTAAALAAFGASIAGGRTPSLATETLRDSRRRAALRRTAALYAIAATMLLTGGATHLWSLHRRLNAVEDRRRALAASLAPAMAQRRLVDAERSTLEALARVERSSPRWTGTLAALARALPDSAYLLSLSTGGQTLRLTGLAVSAHSVVAPLEASPAFTDVALAAASRRDPADRRERFELSVHVDTSATTSPPAAAVQPARRADR